MAARKMLTNASYFAFTATPKNKTLEMFGEPLPPDAEGKVKHRPFHSYTMKQAVEEGFILDVLKAYTPVDSYYKLVKKTEDDPEFDTKKARKKLRRYVESHDHAIRLKAEIMVDHFHEQVMAAGKIGGQARAMVVTSGIERAIQYFHAFKAYLAERKSPYQAIVAFSGEHDYKRRQGQRGVAQRLFQQRHRREDPDRPVPLPDLRRQVPDRLRRAAAAHDVRGQAARGHQGGADPVAAQPRPPAEARLLRARLPEQQRGDHLRFPGLLPHHLLAEETDPNKLHDLKGRWMPRRCIRPSRCSSWWRLFLGGADRDQLDPILDACVAVYAEPARRGRPGGLQGQGQGLLPHLRFPVVGDPLQQRRVGEAVDLPRPADAQAAGAEGGGPRQGHPRSHRHGQLPRREEGGDEDRAGRRGRRDRAGADRCNAATSPSPSWIG
jgi:type I restriction enzyme R subunit